MSIVNFAGSGGKSTFTIPTNHLTKVAGDRHYLYVTRGVMEGKSNMTEDANTNVSLPILLKDAASKFYVDYRVRYIDNKYIKVEKEQNTDEDRFIQLGK